MEAAMPASNTNKAEAPKQTEGALSDAV